MTRALLGGLTPARFLREHWQKKPLLIRGAFPGFSDPISPDELAGLSCEDGIESRIVREKGGARPWEITWGPQAEETFGALPDRGWTLLVQEVNRHVDGAALLLDRFAFLPSVRVDDVMVSYAAPGGSVGPHVDSYDVFLVQGKGRRRWKYGTKPVHDARFRAGLELKILERFAPDRDEILDPGDMLYLPPGFAHHGVAVTECLTYSVGFRAPNAGEMGIDFARHLAERPGASVLLEDPPLSPAQNPGAIPIAMLEKVRAMVRDVDRPARRNDTIDRWFASFATRLSPGHELEAPRRPLPGSAILARLRNGDPIARSEEGRWAFLPHRRSLLLYVGGREIAVAPDATPLAKTLCASRRFEAKTISSLAKNAPSRELLTHLFAVGALRFARASRASRR